MLGDVLFTWANQEHITLKIDGPKVINGNVFIKNSIFSKIETDSTLNIIEKSYYCSIDRCTFLECTSKSTPQRGGAIHFVLEGHGSVSITRTIASDCVSSNEGNFAYLSVKEYASIYIMMTSIDKCAPDNSFKNYHTMFLISGFQTVSNINNTRCFSIRHSCFTNHLSYSAQVEYCNVADNEMKESCLHYMTGNAEVRRVNYVNNRLRNLFVKLEGIISVGFDQTLPRVFLSDCVVQGNAAKYTISVFRADIHIVGCSIQGGSLAKHEGEVHIGEESARGLVTMTLMAGAGKHADIPYRAMTCAGSRKIPFVVLPLVAVLRE